MPPPSGNLIQVGVVGVILARAEEQERAIQPKGEEWKEWTFEMVHLDVAILKEICHNVKEQNHFLKELWSGELNRYHRILLRP